MIQRIFSLLSGIIFGLGLIISGMTNPDKVIGFLSITHNWDASLIFVMGGAILVTLPIFYFMKNKKVSYLDLKLQLPKKNNLDKKLLIGSVCFGVGWGLVGLCPGPAISSISFFNISTFIFLPAMFLGILANKYI